MRFCLLALCVCGALAASSASANSLNAGPNAELVPTGKGYGIEGHSQANGFAKPGGGGGGNTSNGINYHGGPLILNTVNVHFIWYGQSNWPNSTQSNILTNLAQSLGGSNYFNINTTYYDGNNTHVSNSVNYSGATSHAETYGTSLSDAQIQQVVADTNPTDTNGVYFVLTGPDVTASSGFCSQYCGWHTHASILGQDIKYAFVGDAAAQCPSSCMAQTTSPNGDAGADGMASVLAHELEEATTDPDLNAWYDRRGYENADKCAWKFGTESTASNGSKYNVMLGGMNYLIQQNWVNASGGYCSMSY
ncbi:MAG TPA: hypothetical protein VLS52_04510 [Rudaea sp.]|nr:hypothetical protein [Rudaea sp.]